MSKKFIDNKIGTRFFYKTKNTIWYIQDNDNELLNHKINLRDFKYRYYECQKGYKATLEGLQAYRTDFKIWVKELENEKIFYTKFENHEKAIMNIYKSKATNAKKNISIESVDYTEFTYQERCSNGGLISIDKNFINKEIDCYGYDVKKYYPYLLGKSNLQMPIKKGKEVKLKSLSFPLEYGYYKVKIRLEQNEDCYNDPDFYKLFSFSDENVYTHYSLNLVNELNKNYKDENRIKMILNKDEEYNAYVFEKDSLINVSKIFKYWYQHVFDLSLKYPDNKLIKRFSSSLWGYLTEFNRHLYHNDDEYYDLDLSHVHEWEKLTPYKLLDQWEEDEDDMCFEVLETHNLFKTDMARLKSFLTSYARMTMTKMIMREGIIENVIRLQTDGIVLNKPHDFSKTHLNIVPEKKTTGLITWYSCNTNSLNYDMKKQCFIH